MLWELSVVDFILWTSIYLANRMTSLNKLTYQLPRIPIDRQVNKMFSFIFTLYYIPMSLIYNRFELWFSISRGGHMTVIFRVHFGILLFLDVELTYLVKSLQIINNCLINKKLIVNNDCIHIDLWLSKLTKLILRYGFHLFLQPFRSNCVWTWCLLCNFYHAEYSRFGFLSLS